MSLALAVQGAVADVLAAAPSVAEAVPSVLKAVCDTLDWEWGALWELDSTLDRLRCVHTWHVPTISPQHFDAVAHQITFARGEGFPGRVWESGEPVWIEEVTTVSNFPRQAAAAADGLHTALGLPVRLHGEVVAVMEFFSRAPRPLDEAFLATLSPIGSHLGQLLHRRRTEDALRESEALKSAIVESALDCIITIDQEDRIREWNPAAERTFGYPRDAVLGRKMAEIIIPAALREAHYQGMARYLATGEGPVLGRRVEVQALRADGSEFPVELAIAALPTERGPVFTAYLRDISERKRREEELAFLVALNDALRSLAEPTAIMATLTRMLGEHLGASRCAYAEIEADEDHFTVYEDYTRDCVSMAGRHRLSDFGARALAAIRTGHPYVIHDVERELLPGEDPTPYQVAQLRAAICVSLIKGGRLVAGVAVHQNRPRQWTPEEVTLVETVAERAWALIERAHTEKRLRETARQLAEADRRKDDFLVMLAHELRNPLAPMRTALGILQSQRENPRTIDRVRGTLDRQLRHLVRLVDDLLDVSRIIRGRVALQEERLDLTRLVRLWAEDHQPTIEAAGLSLALHTPETPVWVVGDATRLVQVLDNLLQNAMKFTGRGGQLTVTLTTSGPEAVLSVRDTGVGIDPGLLPHLFEIFTQAEQTLARSQGGLGLGLAVVKGLAELHGGTVEAASAGLGTGAEFTLRLPLQAELPALTEAPPSAGSPSRHLRILVVEDNRDAADTLAELLGLFDYDVAVAYTGLEGVEAALRFRPEVVLCDLGLPGCDGYEVARRLRRAPGTACARLIAVTGYGSIEDHERSREAGFDAHLVKPVDADELLGQLEPARATEA